MWHNSNIPFPIVRGFFNFITFKRRSNQISEDDKKINLTVTNIKKIFAFIDEIFKIFVNEPEINKSLLVEDDINLREIWIPLVAILFLNCVNS